MIRPDGGGMNHKDTEALRSGCAAIQKSQYSGAATE